MARAGALAVALALLLLGLSGASGAATQQTPKRGGTLGAVYGIEPACLNILVTLCEAGVRPIHSVLLGAFDQRPDYSWRPRLVSRVDVSARPPFTLTYRIRAEARWSDGTPVTARDFVFTYRAMLAHPEVTGSDRYKDRISVVRPLGAKTVRVVLRYRTAWWHDLFSVVLPEHALRGEDLASVWIDAIDNPKTGAPIASGPYLFDDWERGTQMVLRRNPRYWGRRPAYLDRILIRFAFDPTTIADWFRRGDADVGMWQFTPEIASELRRVGDVRVRVAPDAPGWEHLDIRMQRGGHPALRNKLVRRALAYGIDRVAIVQSVLGDTGATLRPLDSLLYRSGSRSYRPNWGIYRYRPDESRRLLARAGCLRGVDGIYSCAGERLSLRAVSRGGVDRRVRTLVLIRDQLRRAGVEVVPVYATSSAHDQVLASGDFDLTLFAWFDSGPDRDGNKDLYGCGGSQNYGGYCQRLVTAQLDEADRVLDARRREQLLNRADTQLARDVPAIPLFELPTLAGVRSTVHGYVPNFFDPTWNAENWWLDR